MNNLNLVLGWALARMLEPSTWIGLGIASTAVGTALQTHAPLYVAIISGIAAMAAAEKK